MELMNVIQRVLIIEILYTKMKETAHSLNEILTTVMDLIDLICGNMPGPIFF